MNVSDSSQAPSRSTTTTQKQSPATPKASSAPKESKTSQSQGASSFTPSSAKTQTSGAGGAPQKPAAGTPPWQDTPRVQAAERAVQQAQQNLDTARAEQRNAATGQPQQDAAAKVKAAETQLQQAQTVLDLRRAEADVNHWKAELGAAKDPSYATVARQQLSAAQTRLEPMLTPANITYDMRQTALDLSAGKAGAAEIMSGVVQRGVELYSMSPAARTPNGQVDPSKVMDYAMASSARVLVGDAAGSTIEQALKGGPVPGGLPLPSWMVDLGRPEATAHTQQMMDIFNSLPRDGFAGGGLDQTIGGDLNPLFNDGTPNQAFHSFNFIWAGYTLPNDGQGQWIGEAGNFFHEINGDGMSRADYRASHMGLTVGFNLQGLRDMAGSDPANFNVAAALPAIIGGFSADPSSRGQYSINGTQYDFRDAAQQMGQAASDLNWDPRLWFVAGREISPAVRHALGLE